MRSGVSVLVVLLLILAAAGVGAFFLLRPAPPPAATRDERTVADSSAASERTESPSRDIPGIETTATGRVVRLGSGRPVAGATVRLADVETVTGEDGRFSLGPVTSGPAVVELAAEGFPPGRLDVVVDATAPDLGDLALASPTLLAGRVMDAKGDGIAGATVRILERTVWKIAGWGGPALDQIRMGVELLDHGKPPPGIHVTTDADGTFRVDGPSPGRYFLCAHATGHASQTAEAVVPEGGKVDVPITLGPGVTIEGYVDDPVTGRVAGARVFSVSVRAASRLPYEQFHAARSGAEGTFRVEGLIDGERYVIFARAPDGKIGFGIRIAAPREGLRIVVGTRGDVSGTVVDDETGEAVESARVFGILGHTTTDADGAYRLDGYIRNPFLRQIWFEADGYEKHREEIGVGASLLGGDTLHVDVRLKRVKPGTVVATVFDLMGRPVTGATVKVISPGERKETLGSGVTDSTGRATIDGITQQSVHVRAQKTGYVQVVTRDHPREGPMAYPAYLAWTRVVPGERSETRLVLSPMGSLRGIVRDAGGKPLAGVRISNPEEIGKTGEDGKFAVSGVPRDLASFVAFDAEGYLTVRLVVRPGVPVEVVLPRGRAVTGIVVDERDRPVAGARVTAWHPEEERTHGSSSATGADGAFRIDGIGADEVVLRANRRGWPPASSAVIRLDEGKTREGIRIRMARGVEVRLTFEDAGGKDIAASYAFSGPLDRPPAERSNFRRRWNAGSNAATHRVLPGRYRILASPAADAPGGALEVEREIREDVEIRLTFSGEARRIRLETPAESRLIGATLLRTDPAMPRIRLWLQTSEEGRIIESTALPPGRYEVTVFFQAESGQGFRTQILEDLEPGGKPVAVNPPGD